MLDTSRPPKKVLFHAMLLGVHADCIAAEHSGACEKCQNLMLLSMDYNYGHIPTLGEVLDQVIDDWKSDAA